jgi:hypothetical protein
VRNVSLSSLRTQARQRADFEASPTSTSFVPDAELNGYINNSLAELYDLLLEANGDEYYAVSGTPFNTVSGIEGYSLPADFYKLVGIDASVGGFKETLRQFPFGERNRYANLAAPGWYRGARLYYRLRKEQVIFMPVPDGAYAITILYVPNCPILVADGDVFNFHGGWEEYVIADAAIKMQVKEETDTTVLQLAKQGLIARIRAAAPDRDAGAPQVVTDATRGAEDDWLW